MIYIFDIHQVYVLKYFISMSVTTDYRSKNFCECIDRTCKSFFTVFHVTIFYCMCIVGHNSIFFYGSFNHGREQ